MKNQNNIKVGDLVRGKYKCQSEAGVVVKIQKSTVIVDRCKSWYDEYTKTGEMLNMTISRIYA